ncbi:UNVERIFIED_CONTAM: Dynamin-related protein 3A [Sesamum latifolium]|uniref:Dynamin-related protein 3A n=1 Tax=Sesamum latifolium TaxID=2727402 RepID=A0AAW2XKA8_9LAMI
MIEGKNEEMSTSELSGGARIHYIFQHIFVKSLEDVDPCEDLTDDDIVLQFKMQLVPFEVLVRRQIARLLDPSLQCARFIYDELIKMSHRCMINELQRFPVLRKRMDEVIGNFLREGLEPSETMIGHIIEMEMDYINTSHPNFIGGSKAVELALQQTKSARMATPISRQKDGGDSEKALNSERSLKSRAILARQVNGIVQDQGVRPVAEAEKTAVPVNNAGSTWGISSIFGGHDNRTSVKENSTSKPLGPFSEPVQSMEQGINDSSERDQEAIEITVTKLLLRSYYDIVRKNIEDSIPKAIMHFLVNHTKRELHNVFIKKLYRDNLFEEMLQEPDEVAMKRKRTRETLRVLQQAFRTLDELPLEADTVERGYSLGTDPTGLPKIHGLPTSSLYNMSSGSAEAYGASPKNSKSRKSSHSGELHSPYYSDFNGGGRSSMLGLYPTIDA